MQSDPAAENSPAAAPPEPGDAVWDDAFDQIDDLAPLWKRFGAEEIEARQAAARRQFLELLADGGPESAPGSAPGSAIERLLAVNLVVVQAAALDCLQRHSDTFGPEGQGYLRQGARLMELCLRLAGALTREQKDRRRAAARGEAAAAAESRAEPLAPPPTPTDSAAEARQPAATRHPWHRALDPAAPPSGDGPGRAAALDGSAPNGRAPPKGA